MIIRIIYNQNSMFYSSREKNLEEVKLSQISWFNKKQDIIIPYKILKAKLIQGSLMANLVEIAKITSLMLHF